MKDTGKCGVWFDDQDFEGKDVPNSKHTRQRSRDDCLKLCQKTEGCNAIAWNVAEKRCVVKKLPDNYRATYDKGRSAYRVCPTGED